MYSFGVWRWASNDQAVLKQRLMDKLIEHNQHIRKYGQDLPEIWNWKWSNPQ